MTRDTRFWALMAVFQVVFGLAVFAVTRDYYLPESTMATSATSSVPAVGQPAPLWSQGLTEDEVVRLTSPAPDMPVNTDPVDIYLRAEQFFADKQYGQAAQLYEQILALRPDDAEIHNNLGLTLFYLGRTDESLRTLNDGVAADPEHQRIWLTLGYVNSQVGNTEMARAALNNAIRIGTDEAIRESARKMLAALPQ